jgi:hypothetical protein
MGRVNAVSCYSPPLLAVLKAIETSIRTPLIISQNIQVNSGSSRGMTPPAVRPPRVAHTPARPPKTIAAVPIKITSFLFAEQTLWSAPWQNYLALS